MAAEHWEGIRRSPIGELAARDREDEWLSPPADHRTFSTSYFGGVRVTVWDDGVDMTLSLTRESLRNACHDEAIEWISAFLLSHPNPQPSWCALACAVGGLAAGDFEPWPGDPDGPYWEVDTLAAALAALRGSCGYFGIDGYPSPHDGSMSITNTGAGSIEISISDRRWWSMGGRGARFIPWPWLAELRHHDERNGGADRARRAVAQFCLARIELEQAIHELASLDADDAALRTWIDEALAAAQQEPPAPARLRNRLSSLLERGSGTAWPVTFEERYERRGRMPASTARRFLVDDPARHPDDPYVAARAILLRIELDELTPDEAAPQLGSLALEDARDDVRRALSEVRATAHQYEVGLITEEERQDAVAWALSRAWGAVRPVNDGIPEAGDSVR